jgi:hypothetical protein
MYKMHFNYPQFQRTGYTEFLAVDRTFEDCNSF